VHLLCDNEMRDVFRLARGLTRALLITFISRFCLRSDSFSTSSFDDDDAFWYNHCVLPVKNMMTGAPCEDVHLSDSVSSPTVPRMQLTVQRVKRQHDNMDLYNFKMLVTPDHVQVRNN
jgi:hypothetical protein